jgi:hypothetical protein
MAHIRVTRSSKFLNGSGVALMTGGVAEFSEFNGALFQHKYSNVQEESFQLLLIDPSRGGTDLGGGLNLKDD